MWLVHLGSIFCNLTKNCVCCRYCKCIVTMSSVICKLTKSMFNDATTGPASLVSQFLKIPQKSVIFYWGIWVGTPTYSWLIPCTALTFSIVNNVHVTACGSLFQWLFVNMAFNSSDVTVFGFVRMLLAVSLHCSISAEYHLYCDSVWC